MKKNYNIQLIEGYLRYLTKEVTIFCPRCGRTIKGLIGICLDQVGTPFLKAVKVCKCGYKPALDELLEELD